MKKNCVITLGSRTETKVGPDGDIEVEVPFTYTIKPLTLAQSREIGVGMFPETPDTLAGNFDFNFEQAMRVVLAALARDYPNVTREMLMGMEIPWPDLDHARNKVLEYSGYRLPKTDVVAAAAAAPAAPGAQPGEAGPGAA